jgi:uncharacterized SAM-binding protein YcdF (DUF218 family)
MKLPKISFGWIVALVLLLLGFLVKAMPGFSFSALILWGMSAVAVCYRLLHILGKKYAKSAKILGRILTVCLCVGILVAAVTGCFIIRGAYGNPGQDCRYVIVLGAGVNGSVPSLSLRERIDAAYEYLVAHPQAICIVSGGQGNNEDISEAECMFRELTAMGIEADRVWMEDKATSTRENLRFSLALIQERTGNRPETVGLISSEYHLFRAGLLAEDEGVTAIGIPAETSWISLRINYFLREIAGVWAYWILGA